MPAENGLILLLVVVTILSLTALVTVWWHTRQTLASRSLASGGNPEGSQASPLTDGDRQSMLDLLQQLAGWTSEYSGNVSRYQNRLGTLSREFRTSSGNEAPATQRVLGLLSEIMHSNADLQKRLETAEAQLDRQTRQIESYLSEARTDALTQLANRRAFDAKLAELFANYRKGGKSFVMVLIDIDHFKSVNDTHGHLVGDEVLRYVASAFRQSFENAYLIARYGGEEFVLLLPGPLRVAGDRVDRMRKALASEWFIAEDVRMNVRFSAGLSEPQQELVPGHMVRRADEALYAAKNRGRNRVYLHDGTQTMLLGAPEIADTTQRDEG